MKKIWILEFSYYYSEKQYITVYFIGDEEWAQEQANKYIKNLPEWLLNQVSIGDRKIKPYKGNNIFIQDTEK